MKNLLKLFIFVNVLSFSSMTAAQVVEERATTNQGIPIIRFINTSRLPAFCYYSDDSFYFTFALPPYSRSQWTPVSGAFQWECSY